MTDSIYPLLPAFIIDVWDEKVTIELNQNYSKILEEIRLHCDDISHTDEWSYHASSTTEVLFCRCMEYLKDLIRKLTVLASEGSVLAKKHLQDASQELEWQVVNSEGLHNEDDCPFTDCSGAHYFYLRNPSKAAQELWEINF